MSSPKCGLSHLTGNLKCLLNYCYNKNYVLVVPYFHLSARHNHGKAIQSNFTKYYDYSKLKINDTHYPIALELPTNAENVITSPFIQLPRSGLVKQVTYFKESLTSLNIDLPYTKNIYAIASSISNEIGTPYTCIHVRRGDRIRTEKQNKETSVENIKKKIIENNLKKVYIMTNEKISFFDELRNIPGLFIYFYTDFEDLKHIQDNYYLFCIEKVICQNATIRISTFKTNNTYYNDYLSDTKGFQ